MSERLCNHTVECNLLLTALICFLAVHNSHITCFLLSSWCWWGNRFWKSGQHRGAYWGKAAKHWWQFQQCSVLITLVQWEVFKLPSEAAVCQILPAAVFGSNTFFFFLSGLDMLHPQITAVTKSILQEGWGTAVHTYVVILFLGRNGRGQWPVRLWRGGGWEEGLSCWAMFHADWRDFWTARK